jgi:hypothetical protein
LQQHFKKLKKYYKIFMEQCLIRHSEAISRNNMKISWNAYIESPCSCYDLQPRFLDARGLWLDLTVTPLANVIKCPIIVVKACILPVIILCAMRVSACCAGYVKQSISYPATIFRWLPISSKHMLRISCSSSHVLDECYLS